MSDTFVSFDEVRLRVNEMLDDFDLPADVPSIYLIRDLFGRLGVSVPTDIELNGDVWDRLLCLAHTLQSNLGAHGPRTERPVLQVSNNVLQELKDTARNISPKVFWVDRLLVGGNWWTVGDRREPADPIRYTLHSVKGGSAAARPLPFLAGTSPGWERKYLLSILIWSHPDWRQLF